ncbi:MAG: outer membrane beta-barrel protein [Gemmatimonadetes bacterium]|nr:outer membrane beta-barrel protein [Gemmatimonadota bacterium]
MRRIVGLWILLWVLSPTAFAVAQEEGHRGGFGVFAELYSPLFNFRDMYTEGFKLGAAAHFVTSPTRIVEVEYYYSKFAGGSLEERTFRFKDGRDYTSPQAKSDMTFNSLVVNWLFALKDKKFEGEGSVPYLTVGAGFHNYHSKVSGLIFPEQGGATLDQTLLLEAIDDTRTALGVSGGAGMQIFLGPKAALDLRVSYNVIVEELRPFLNWGVKKTHPFHLFDIGAGVKFYM